MSAIILCSLLLIDFSTAQKYPVEHSRFFEPFLGSGAILATVSPRNGLGSDTFGPSMEIWIMLKNNPKTLINWYAERYNLISSKNKEDAYAAVLCSYNANRHVDFQHCDYKAAFHEAKSGDMIYCDPPYSHSQSILYGAQDFKLSELLHEIAMAKERGVKVALSIDGQKKSGNYVCDLPIPDNLFESDIYIDCGRSMLRRFQREGETLEDDQVSDRLLLSY